MSEIIAVRDLAMVTSDIKYAQRQGARQLASNLIEIGRLLVEAKTMVEPKDWEKYIWDNFGYSTSSADNWMKLYREYGNDQESLFDSFANSQTFGKLSYTQLLALTALPAEERAEFVEHNDVENMSTRQLQQAIRERDEARQALAAAEQRVQEAEDQNKKRDDESASAISDAKRAADQLRARAETAEKEKQRAEKSESNALSLVKKLEKQLADAKAAEESAKADLKKEKDNQDVPNSVMEQLRREAEAEAAKKAADGIQKKLDAAEKSAREAAKAKEIAEAAAREAKEKLVAAQKAQKLSNQDMTSINVLGQQILSIWDTIQKHREAAIAEDPVNGKPIDGFLGKLLDTLRDSILEEE